ncbi:MAG: lipoyl(octanoyl) transferase LipB [Lewinellaceae bacterium]|nr:lipoyl(octanoyl) transferase LipB [Lewinellaceae bacterium]
MQTVFFRDLGRMDYKAAWDYQTDLHRSLVDNKLNNRSLAPGAYPQEHYLLFVEHPPVYTLGKSGSLQNLLLNEVELQARGIQYFPINRGGDITFHGPGQIVGYPILDLECFFTDVHKYVRNLEEVVIRTLADYGLEAFRIKDYTGVWLKDGQTADGRCQMPDGRRQAAEGERGASAVYRKICAIGVHLSRWVTLHGWAFNVNTPLEYFDYIVPCGISDADKTVTSLAIELGGPVDQQEVTEKLKRHFSDVFACKVSDDRRQG